jgi:small subunit ribosomal protein S17
MPTKNNEELEAEGTATETRQDETTAENTVAANEAGSDEKPKRTRKAKSDDAKSEATTEDSSLIGSVLDTVTSAVSGVASVIADGVSAVVEAVTPDSATEEPKPHLRKRAEKIGIVQSDKMTNTVTVRVDRVVKHPVYRKYIKRRKKFMAHDEKGAAIGDKVRIVETRPLSAKKRWRVVEIIQKAER